MKTFIPNSNEKDEIKSNNKNISIEERIVKLDNDHTVPVKIMGSGKVPCMICGPSSIYAETMPDSFFKLFQLIVAPIYWETGSGAASGFSDEDIKKLSFDDMLKHNNEVQQKLGFDKVVVLGPSAVGVYAAEYARKYPASTLGVIGLGTPLTNNFASTGLATFEGTFNPNKFPKMATEDSKKWWQEYQQDCEKYKNWANSEEGKKALSSKEPKDLLEGYLKWLRTVDLMLYHVPGLDPLGKEELEAVRKVAAQVEESWKRVNEITREHFFELFNQWKENDFKKLADVTAPMKVLLGGRDFLAPPTLVTKENGENLDNLPKKFSYDILEECGHNVPLDCKSDKKSEEKLEKIMTDWLEKEIYPQLNNSNQNKIDNKKNIYTFPFNNNNYKNNENKIELK